MKRSISSPVLWQSCLLTAMIFFSLVRTAQSHIESGPMPDAVAEMEYRILLEFSPEDCKIRNKLGMVLYRRNQLEEAASEFNLILTVNPSDFDALDGMGLVLARMKKDSEAIAYFKRALAMNGKDLMVYYHLGNSLARTGSLTEAEKAYLSGLEVFCSATKTALATGNDSGSMYRKALDEVRVKIKAGK